MKPITRWSLLGGIALFAAATGFFLSGQYPSERIGDLTAPSNDRVLATTKLLALSLPDVGAINQPLKQWQGKLLVVNFWATWCAPCREEMPGFSRLQDKLAAKGIQFVGIAFDSADNVQKFSVTTPVSYPLLIGGSELLQITAGLGNAAGGLPFTVVIGRDGSLLQSRLGIWKATVLEASLAELVE